MIVCAWCRKGLIERFRDETAMHSSCKACLLVHTVCDYCLANLLSTMDGEAVTGRISADHTAQRPNATAPGVEQCAFGP